MTFTWDLRTGLRPPTRVILAAPGLDVLDILKVACDSVGADVRVFEGFKVRVCKFMPESLMIVFDPEGKPWWVDLEEL